MAEQFLTIKSTLDDPEFDQIEVKLRKKVAADPTSSFGIERAVLRWIADHIPSWAKYCIDSKVTGKSLGQILSKLKSRP